MPASQESTPDGNHGDRHGWNDRWCELLGRIIAASHAERVLNYPLPARGGLVVLPSFAWQPAGISVGRKDRAKDGGRLLLPIRIAWAKGSVAVVEAEQPETAEWSARGLGVHLTGRTALIATGSGSADTDMASLNMPPATVRTPIIAAHQLRSALEELRADGQLARFEALMMAEPDIHTEVRMAHMHIVRSTLPDPDGDVDGVGLLDEEALQVSTNRMLLGDTDSASVVQDLLDKSTQPDAFLNVDPQKFARKLLHRAAQEEIRQTVGDPRAGAKIRAVARELGVDGTGRGGADQVLAAYRARFPEDKMGLDRVQQALSIRPMRRLSLGSDGWLD